ncbi:MAG: response regulator transcription factor [Burkholderiales bacterium]|nr:response regulator transcription factor [Burkholderiales bacterium]
MRTLIIDDHQLFSAGLRLLLAALVPVEQVVRCADGAAALDLATHTAFDLVLLDWKLGEGITGEPLIHRLKELLPAARIVVVSGEARPETVRRAVEAGAVGFVPKESSPELMTAALTLATSGGIYLPVSALNDAGGPAAPPTGHGLRELAEAFPDLTERHRTVLSLLARGMSNKSIARELDITEGTVKQHVSAIFREMAVASRTEAVYLLATRGVRFE